MKIVLSDTEYQDFIKTHVSMSGLSMDQHWYHVGRMIDIADNIKFETIGNTTSIIITNEPNKRQKNSSKFSGSSLPNLRDNNGDSGTPPSDSWCETGSSEQPTQYYTPMSASSFTNTSNRSGQDGTAVSNSQDSAN